MSRTESTIAGRAETSMLIRRRIDLLNTIAGDRHLQLLLNIDAETVTHALEVAREALAILNSTQGSD